MSTSDRVRINQARREAKKIGESLILDKSGGVAKFERYLARVGAEKHVEDLPSPNIMEVLFFVFRQSIEGTNEDRKYHLRKLEMFNDIAEALSDYLDELVETSNDLAREESRGKGRCDPRRPTRIINKIETANSKLEGVIRKANPRDRQRSEVRALLEQVQHSKKVIAAAKTAYAKAARSS